MDSMFTIKLVVLIAAILVVGTMCIITNMDHKDIDEECERKAAEQHKNLKERT